MTADEIRALRKRRGLTRAALARQVGVLPADVAGWELGQRFPTKKAAARLAELVAHGEVQRDSAAVTPWARLADPSVWALVRKLLAHRELLERAQAMAEAYADPKDRA
jgi:transcriptional regulator with XRE-family HTH domain